MRMIQCIHCGKKFSTAETYIEIDGLKYPKTGFVTNAKNIYVNHVLKV